MRYLFRKKRWLLLLAICLTALFAVTAVPQNSHSDPFSSTIEGSGRVMETARNGDNRSLDDKARGNAKVVLPFDFRHVVPEPSTLLLVGSGLIGFALYARKRFRK